MPKFIVLCGKTGSGKTLLLQQLELRNYPCVDLENIASHRGSVFGELLLPSQPSQKDFEQQLQKKFDCYKKMAFVFIEQKSSSIGKRKIPHWLYTKMNEGIFVRLDAEKKIRIQNILQEYGDAGKEDFINALHKLKDRLPINFFKEAEAFLQRENYYAFIEKMLDYYDNTLKYKFTETAEITITVETNEPLQIMQQLLQALKEAGISIS